MKYTQKILLLTVLFLNGCISQFIPNTKEGKEMLIVEGLITDKPGTNMIKLSRSMPLGKRSTANPVSGCNVSISDDLGSRVSFNESEEGTYVAPGFFHGIIGRFYTLHITQFTESNTFNFESYPMELKPVPPIDSVYYEKVIIQESIAGSMPQEGCQVFVNTHDATNQCRFYRWEYTETWKMEIPYPVTNKICYITDKSDIINVKSTSSLEEDRINRYPLNFISNLTDRLSMKYSILVNQYSLNEDEYLYWEKLQNISEQVGGLYDMIPAAIPSNIYCIEDPNEKVLGYFSVSASSSKRTFIKNYFRGLAKMYPDDVCISDTIYGSDPIPFLNSSVWILESSSRPPYSVITSKKGCADCTVRGTTVIPEFWIEGK